MNQNDFIMNIIGSLNKTLTNARLKSDLKTFDDKFYVKVVAKLSKTLASRELKRQLKELNNLYVQIEANIKVDKGTKDKLQQNIKTLQQSLSDIEIGLKTSKTQQSKIIADIESIKRKAQQKVQSTPISFNLEVRKAKVIADIEYLGKRYSKLFSNTSASQKYETLMQNALSISGKSKLSDTRAELAAFTSELKANGLAAKSTGDKWRDLVERSKDLFSAASIIRVVFQQMREMTKTTLGLDTEMTNLYKVQNDISSREQFSGILKKWNKLAQELSVTTQSLISATGGWSKIGFNLDMSEQLSRLTAIFEKTAEISTEQATSTLISAAQAYTEIIENGVVLGEEDYVKRVEAIGNKVNAIGNKYAIDSEGIANGLQNSSAALKVAGNSLDETISLITATNKIFQSPEEGSNMLKVASMRLRGQVNALKEMGEDAEGVSTDITKIQQQIYELTNDKVNIFEDDSTLKSTYQMVLEIGKVFEGLNDRQQANILEVMFGKQRGSAGAALLLNYKELESIKNDSMNSANSMAEEYSKYLESAEAHIISFKEKLVEAYQGFMSGDTLVYASDFGSAILDILNKTDLLRHALLALATIKIGQGISTFGLSISNAAKQMNTLGSALEKVKSLPLDETLKPSVLAKVGIETKNLTDRNLKLLLSQKNLTENDRVAILSKHELTQEEAKAKLEKMGLTTATKAQATANVTEATTTHTLSGAMKTLKASIIGCGQAIKTAILSNPVGWGLMAITTAVSILSTAITNHNQKLEESRQKNIEASDKASEQAKQLGDLYQKYMALASVTDKTATQEEEFSSVVKDTISALGDKASALEGLTAGTEEYTKALKGATQAELENLYAVAVTGRKAAEEELQKSAVSSWSGSTVSIPLNEQMTGVEEHVKALDVVRDILSEFEDMGANGLEWEPVNWDSNNKDMARLVEYYDKIIQSRKALIMSAQQTGDESILDTGIYKQIDTVINNLSDDIDTYLEKKYEESKLEYQMQQGIPATTEEYEKMKHALAENSEVGEYFNSVIGDMLAKDYSDLAVGVQETADAINELPQESQSISLGFTEDQLKKIDEAKSSLSGLSTEIAKLNSGQSISSTDILGLIENYDLDAVKAWASTKELKNELVRVSRLKLNNAISDIYAMQEAGAITVEQFEALRAILKDITKQDFSKLNLDGFNTNIDAIQSSYTTLSTAVEEYNKYSGYSIDTVQALLALEPQYLDLLDMKNGKLSINEEGYRLLVDAQMAEAEASIYGSAIAELTALTIEKAGQSSAEAAQKKQDAVAGINAETSALQENTQAALDNAVAIAQREGVSQADINAIIEKTTNRVNAIQSAVKGLNVAPNKKSSSSSSKSTKETKESINWIERKLDVLGKKLERLKDKTENVFSSWGGKNKNIDKEIKNLESQIKVYTKAQSTYKKEYSKIKLSDNIISKIKNGSMDISSYDSATAKKIKEYQDLYDKQQDCTDKVAELHQSIRDLNQEKLDNIIDAFDRVIGNSNSRSNEIQARIDLKLSTGEAVAEADYQELRKESKYVQTKLQKEVAKYSKQAEKDWKTAQKTYKAGTDEYNNAKKAYEDSKAKVSELNAELSKEKQNYHDINKAILETPLRQLERQKELLEQQSSALDKIKSKYSDMISAVTYYVGNQIDALNKAKSAITDTYDSMVDPLKEQLEYLQNANDERERAIALQKAQAALDAAKSQNTVAVMKDGKFSYEADAKTLKEAQESYDKVIYDNTVSSLQNQVKELETQRDNLLEGYDEQIDRLNDISDKWSKIISDAEMMSKIDMFESTYGSLEQILNGSNVAYDSVKGNVEKIQKSLDDIAKVQEVVDEQILAVEKFVSAWEYGEASFVKAQEGITSALEDHTSINAHILAESQEMVNQYMTELDDSAKGLGLSLEESVDGTKLKLESLTEPFEELKTALDKTNVEYENFKKLSDEMSGTLPSSVEQLENLVEVTDNLSTAFSAIGRSITAFIPQISSLDTVSESIKTSFESTSAVMEDISTNSMSAVTTALTGLHDIVELVNKELGVDGVQALTNYMTGLTRTITVINQVDSLTKLYTASTQSLNVELTASQQALKDFDTAMLTAMTTLDSMSAMALSTATNFGSMASNINSAAAAYRELAAAKEAANSVSDNSSKGSGGVISRAVASGVIGAIGVAGSIFTGKAYAEGTKSAEAGVHLVGEEVPELILSGGKYTLVKKPSLVRLNSGDTVFNGAKTREIMKGDFSKLNPDFVKSLPYTQPNMFSMNTSMPNVVPRAVSQSFSTGDIHLHEVEKVDNLADQIVKRLPIKMSQKIFNRE